VTGRRGEIANLKGPRLRPRPGSANGSRDDQKKQVILERGACGFRFSMRARHGSYLLLAFAPTTEGEPATLKKSSSWEGIAAIGAFFTSEAAHRALRIASKLAPAFTPSPIDIAPARYAVVV
jgi:hypothetical protein